MAENLRDSFDVANSLLNAGLQKYPESTLSAALTTAAKKDNTHISHLDPKTGLVIRTHSYTADQLIQRALDPATRSTLGSVDDNGLIERLTGFSKEKQERLMDQMFPAPRPYVSRKFYTLGRSREGTPQFQQWASLVLEQENSGLLFLPTYMTLTMLGQRGQHRAETFIYVSDSTLGGQLSICVSIEDYFLRRAITLDYSGTGDLSFMFVNPIAAEANCEFTSKGYAIGNREIYQAKDPKNAELKAIKAFDFDEFADTADLEEEDGVRYLFRRFEDDVTHTPYLQVQAIRELPLKPVNFRMSFPLHISRNHLLEAYTPADLMNNPLTTDTTLDQDWLRAKIQADAGINW